MNIKAEKTPTDIPRAGMHVHVRAHPTNSRWCGGTDLYVDGARVIHVPGQTEQDQVRSHRVNDIKVKCAAGRVSVRVGKVSFVYTYTQVGMHALEHTYTEYTWYNIAQAIGIVVSAFILFHFLWFALVGAATMFIRTSMPVKVGDVHQLSYFSKGNSLEIHSRLNTQEQLENGDGALILSPYCELGISYVDEFNALRARYLYKPEIRLEQRCTLILQSDHNLVLYSSQNKVLWSTGTTDSQIARLFLASNGKLFLENNRHEPLYEIH